MSAMSKEHWLDLVLDLMGTRRDDLSGPDLALLTMTRAQLVAVEFALVSMRDRHCQVGCGDCDSCKAKNAESKAAYDKAHPVVGKMVRLLPMTMASRRWTNKNTHRRTNAAKMIKRVGERFTVLAPTGRRKTFGPQDACWSLIEVRS